MTSKVPPPPQPKPYEIIFYVALLLGGWSSSQPTDGHNLLHFLISDKMLHIQVDFGMRKLVFITRRAFCRQRKRVIERFK